MEGIDGIDMEGIDGMVGKAGRRFWIRAGTDIFRPQN
jgi:hypothetical protein